VVKASVVYAMALEVFSRSMTAEHKYNSFDNQVYQLSGQRDKSTLKKILEIGPYFARFSPWLISFAQERTGFSLPDTVRANNYLGST
jgi:hypothetical protein